MRKKVGWFLLTGLVLSASLILGTSCKKDEFYEQLGPNKWVFVDYDDEARVFLITNHCSPDWPDPPDIAWRDSNYQQEMLEFIGSTSYGCTKMELTDDLPLAVEKVKEYRWVEVNSSLKSLDFAKALAAKKLIQMFGEYDRTGILRGLVLIYLPQGPRAEEVPNLFRDFPHDEQKDEMWLEMHQLLCGCFPEEHPDFRDTFDYIVTTTSDVWGDPIMVWSKSYASHQVLEVIRNKQNVLWYNVGPAFGLFSLTAGNETWDDVRGVDCTPGRLCEGSDRNDLDPNPEINHYRDNIRYATVPQCMITSYNDCFSLANCSALTSHNYHDWFTRRNMCPPLMDAPVLADYSPEYVAAEDPDPTFDPPETRYCYTYGTPTERMDPSCYRYGNPFVNFSIWENLSPAGPRSLKIIRARDDSDPYNPAADAHHTEYFIQGTKALEEVLTNPVATGGDGHSECTRNFPIDCPACDVADTILDPTSPLHEVPIELHYRRVPGTRILPENRVRNDDVVYLPDRHITRPITPFQLSAAYTEVSGRDSPGYEGQFHVADNRTVVYMARIFRPEDPEANDEVLRVRFFEGIVEDPSATLVEIWFDDMTRWRPERDRLRTDYNGAWTPHEFFLPDGRYHDMAGAWFDVNLDATIWDVEDSLEYDVQSDASRVLVMSWDGPGQYFNDPVPDVRNMRRLTEETIYNDYVGFPFAFQIFTANSSRLWLVRVYPITPADPSPDPIARTYLGSDHSPPTGSYYTYRVNWDARATWCIAYPNDQVCRGPDPDHTDLPVTMRVQAWNTEGRYFYRDYEVTIRDRP